MKRLDLTINGKLNTKHTKIFEDICSKNISSFTTLIGKISLNYKNNLDWHLSLPASRNTLISDLFYYWWNENFFKTCTIRKCIVTNIRY